MQRLRGKPKDFNGTTPVEDFLQQIKTCAKYYCWSDEECSIPLRCALIGESATLVWSQLHPDSLSYQQLKTLLHERYRFREARGEVSGGVTCESWRDRRRAPHAMSGYNTPHGIGVSRRCMRHEPDDGSRSFSRGA